METDMCEHIAEQNTEERGIKYDGTRGRERNMKRETHKQTERKERTGIENGRKHTYGEKREEERERRNHKYPHT